MTDLLLTEVAGNSFRRWLICAAVVFGMRLLLGLVRRALRGRLGRWLGRLPGAYDDAILNAVAGTRGWFLWVVALYTGGVGLKLPKDIDHGLDVTFMTLTSLQAGLWAQRFIRDVVGVWTQREPQPSSRSRTCASIART